MQDITFEVRGEFITLDKLIKACGLSVTGGHAKLLVAEGLVTVDGRPESRKTAKIRPGQVVTLGDARISVVADGQA